MARKRRDKEEELEIEEAEEEAVEAEEPANEPLDFEEPPDDDRGADEPPEDEEEEVERAPSARTPIFTIVLLILNFLAAPPFVILAFMDYAARLQWSHATLVNRIGPLGLPLAQDEQAASAWAQTRPRVRIDNDKLAAAYRNRPRPGAPAMNEPFQSVDTTEEHISFAIRPSQIDGAVKADLFQGLGQGVSTLEEEVDRLKKLVPDEIEKAATQYVKDRGTEDKKKAAAERILLPLAWGTKNVEELQQRIDAAKGEQLDKLLNDAVQRQMLMSLMAPMNIYRPGSLGKFDVEKVVELDKQGEYEFSLDVLKGLLQKRFDDAIADKYIGLVHFGIEDQKQDDVEKRHSIAFLLFSVARLKAPDAKEPLFDKGLERAQVVSGLYEFAQAAANYVRTLRVLEKRVLNAIESDREGDLVRDKDDPAKVVTRTAGFMDKHAADIVRLKKVVAEIRFTKKRLEDLDAQKARYQKHLDDRTALRDEVTKRLVEARGETAKLATELQMLELEIFLAQRQLSDAAERNAALEQQIVQHERLLQQGGKK